MPSRKASAPPVHVVSEVYAGIDDHDRCRCGHYAAHHTRRQAKGRLTVVQCWDCPCTSYRDGKAQPIGDPHRLDPVEEA